MFKMMHARQVLTLLSFFFSRGHFLRYTHQVCSVLLLLPPLLRALLAVSISFICLRSNRLR